MWKRAHELATWSVLNKFKLNEIYNDSSASFHYTRASFEKLTPDMFPLHLYLSCVWFSDTYHFNEGCGFLISRLLFQWVSDSKLAVFDLSKSTVLLVLVGLFQLLLKHFFLNFTMSQYGERGCFFNRSHIPVKLSSIQTFSCYCLAAFLGCVWWSSNITQISSLYTIIFYRLWISTRTFIIPCWHLRVLLA